MSQFKKYLEIVNEARTPEERTEYKKQQRESGSGYTYTTTPAGVRAWVQPRDHEPQDIANDIKYYLDMDYSPSVGDEIVHILKNNEKWLWMLEKNTKLKQKMSKFFGHTVIKLKDFIEKYDKGEIRNKKSHSH